MPHWVTFNYKNENNFGVINTDTVEVYSGDMFNNPTTTGQELSVSDIKLLNPCNPSKIIALWNNYKTLADEKGLSKPNNPLYLNKAISCISQPGQNIVRPKSYNEAIFYEGELGIVIGKHCKDLEPDETKDYIFGFTCINDVTGMDIVKKDPSFDQK